MKKLISMVLSINIALSGLAVTSFAAKKSATPISNNSTNIEFNLKKSLTNVTIEEALLLLQAINNKTEPKKSFFSSFSKDAMIFGVGIAFQLFRYIKTTFEANRQQKNTPQVSTSPSEVISYFNEEIRSVKGQNSAKKQLKNILANIIDSRSQAISTGEKYKKSDVIYMAGPSGVGKSLSADCLAKALSGSKANPIIIEASDIDTGSTKSVKEQLFDIKEKKVFKDVSITQYSSLLEILRKKPDVVIIINEYDKFGTMDTDEMLRTAMDHGSITVNGEKINCAGAVFIITSNESSDSIKGKNQDMPNVDDGTGSRTFRKHDKAFLNRLNIVEFENLTENDYLRITKQELEKLVLHYLKNYDIELKFGDVCKNLAKKASDLNVGARIISKLLAGFRSKIISCIVDDVANTACRGKAFDVSYNCNDDIFSLEETNRTIPLLSTQNNK